jgi:hypothetical protein
VSLCTELLLIRNFYSYQIRAEEEKERLERELMAMRRQMQQMKAEQEASIEHLKKNVKSVRLPCFLFCIISVGA